MNTFYFIPDADLMKIIAMDPSLDAKECATRISESAQQGARSFFIKRPAELTSFCEFLHW